MASLTLEQHDLIQRASSAFTGAVVFSWRQSGSPGNVIVSSFARTPERNRDVGGKRGSQHLIGTAVDLVNLVGGSMVLSNLAANAKLVGLVAVPESDHLHLQLWSRDLRIVERFFPQLVI